MADKTPREILEGIAKDLAGGNMAELARMCNQEPNALYRYGQPGREIPLKYGVFFQIVSNGAVPLERSCPKVAAEINGLIAGLNQL